MHSIYGIKRKFETPEDLQGAFEEYVEWAHNNPWYKKEAIKSGDMAGTIIDIPHERPLTEWDFAAFCKLSYQGLRNYGEKSEYKDYFDIYNQCKTRMTAQRISGGLSDIYNANLVARIDGISEKNESKHNVSFSIAEQIRQAHGEPSTNDSDETK